jgi:hypothetical protein
MAISNSKITALGGSIFSTPAGEVHALTCMIYCNTSLIDAFLSVHLLPSGKSSTDIETSIIKSLLIPPGETFTFDSEKLILEGGDAIFASASADDTLVVSLSTMRVS